MCGAARARVRRQMLISYYKHRARARQRCMCAYSTNVIMPCAAVRRRGQGRTALVVAEHNGGGVVRLAVLLVALAVLDDGLDGGGGKHKDESHCCAVSFEWRHVRPPRQTRLRCGHAQVERVLRPSTCRDARRGRSQAQERDAHAHGTLGASQCAGAAAHLEEEVEVGDAREHFEEEDGYECDEEAVVLGGRHGVCVKLCGRDVRHVPRNVPRRRCLGVDGRRGLLRPSGSIVYRELARSSCRDVRSRHAPRSRHDNVQAHTPWAASPLARAGWIFRHQLE